jgi:hypothetical protein
VHICYLGPRLGNGTKVIDHVGLGHTDATITDTEDLVIFVRSYTNIELLLRIKNGGVGERRITNFVESIRAIGDEFTKEDFFVGVERVCSRVLSMTRR